MAAEKKPEEKKEQTEAPKAEAKESTTRETPVALSSKLTRVETYKEKKD